MWAAVRRESGAAPALAFSTPGGLEPFRDGWRELGSYDPPQFCWGCGLLTRSVYQHRSGPVCVACDRYCASIVRSGRLARSAAALERWAVGRSILLDAARSEEALRLLGGGRHPLPLEICTRRGSDAQARARALWGEEAVVLDVTSRADPPWARCSPFYPHGGIPVPWSPGYVGMSVEGVWQALKVFPASDVDEARLSVTSMRGLKRRGRVLGHREGMVGTRLLSYVEARRLIYLPCYLWVLEHHLQPEVGALRRWRALGMRIVLLDFETNTEVEDLSAPLSHAGLIKRYVEGRWPG